MELHLRLGVDGKHADQMVRGTIVLPNGLGKSKKVLVIASGDKQREATEAGADFVGGDDMVNKIQNENWTDFDAVIATPDMMRGVGRLGKVLGPRGLMPNPKTGTVTNDIAQAVKEVKAGKVEFRLDKTNCIHCPVGKVSFEANALVENTNMLLQAVVKAKPAAAKGKIRAQRDHLLHHGPRRSPGCDALQFESGLNSNEKETGKAKRPGSVAGGAGEGPERLPDRLRKADRAAGFRAAQDRSRRGRQLTRSSRTTSPRRPPRAPSRRTC